MPSTRSLSLLPMLCLLLMPAGCAKHESPSVAGACPAVRFPELVVASVTTPTEVDIGVALAPSANSPGLPLGYWQSAALDRGATSPEGAPWTNDASIVSEVWVTSEPGPVLHLGTSRTARGGNIFGTPLALHLTFDEKLSSPECASTGRLTHVDVELTLVADSGPLRVGGFRAAQRASSTGR